MPATEKIAFKPALAEMFAENLHYTPVGGEVVIHVQRFGHPDPVRRL